MIWDHKTKVHIDAIHCGESEDKKLRTEYKKEEKCLPLPSDFITQKKAVRVGSLQIRVKLLLKVSTNKAVYGIHRVGSLHSCLARVRQSSTEACSPAQISLLSVSFPWQIPWAQLCYLYISRAIPKSPILATLPGPRQVRRQFLAAISLQEEGRKATERGEPLNHSPVLQSSKKPKSSTDFLSSREPTTARRVNVYG